VRRFTDYLILLAVLVAVGSCAHREEAPLPVHNPMVAIWSGICDGIDRLEASRATFAEWSNQAEDSKVLDAEKDLRESLRGTDLSDAELAMVLSKHRKSSKTVLFGFEGNFHALVVFGNDNRPVHVVKW
jgi:hypothetical protein